MKNNKKLKKSESGEMFYKLCLAISEVKKPEEVAILLGDLLSSSEVEMISKRLKIAEMIIADLSYEDIRRELKVGNGTIARIQEWLKISGDGYRKAVESIKNKNVQKESKYFNGNISSIKKKYPMYYWPEIVLENIIKNSSKKQKDELRKVIKEMDKLKDKTDLYKKLKRMNKYL